MAEKLYFGAPGNIQEIPYPKTGMGFGSNVDAEVTALVSGGRSVYRAPTAYKTLDMSWRTNSTALQHVIDMYNGQFGPGPFYITDPTANQLNVLPARWANSWQLAHVSNGWGRPIIDSSFGWPTLADYKTARTNQFVKFTQAASGSTVKLEKIVRTRLIRIPGKTYYLAVSGSATGGAGIKVRGLNDGTQAWDALTTFTTFTGVPTSVLAAASTQYSMIELDLYLPLGATLTLKGMALGTIAYTNTETAWMPRGSGIGPVSFEQDFSGDLVSTTIDRIGLSLSMTEVQTVESVML